MRFRLLLVATYHRRLAQTVQRIFGSRRLRTASRGEGKRMAAKDLAAKNLAPKDLAPKDLADAEAAQHGGPSPGHIHH